MLFKLHWLPSDNTLTTRSLYLLTKPSTPPVHPTSQNLSLCPGPHAPFAPPAPLPFYRLATDESPWEDGPSAVLHLHSGTISQPPSERPCPSPFVLSSHSSKLTFFKLPARTSYDFSIFEPFSFIFYIFCEAHWVLEMRYTRLIYWGSSSEAARQPLFLYIFLLLLFSCHGSLWQPIERQGKKLRNLADRFRTVP